MDRNIITVEAAAAHNRARLEELHRYIRETGGRVAEALPGKLGGELPIDLQKPDTWYEQIVKYIPVESLSMYLTLDKGIQASTQNSPQEGTVLLALALVAVVVFNFAYLVWKLSVRSRWQTIISCLALVAYVYISGGVFEAMHLTSAAAQLFVLVVTGAVLIFFPLPAGSSQPGASSATGTG
jgi:hypothetical protein